MDRNILLFLAVIILAAIALLLVRSCDRSYCETRVDFPWAQEGDTLFAEDEELSILATFSPSLPDTPDFKWVIRDSATHRGVDSFANENPHTYTFKIPGKYEVVFRFDGCDQMWVQGIKVGRATPRLSFNINASKDTFKINETISLTCSYEGEVDTSALSWQLASAKGKPTPGLTYTHTVRRAGADTVKLYYQDSLVSTFDFVGVAKPKTNTPSHTQKTSTGGLSPNNQLPPSPPDSDVAIAGRIKTTLAGTFTRIRNEYDSGKANEAHRTYQSWKKGVLNERSNIEVTYKGTTYPSIDAFYSTFRLMTGATVKSCLPVLKNDKIIAIGIYE